MDSQLLVGRCALVVEDEMLVLMAIEDMLSDLGCTAIAVAANVEQALALIETSMFDLAMIDVNLGGQRSYPVAVALREADVPFAFSTGFGEHGVDEGFSDCLVLNKPFNSHQFVTVVRGLLNIGDERATAAA